MKLRDLFLFLFVIIISSLLISNGKEESGFLFGIMYQLQLILEEVKK